MEEMQCMNCKEMIPLTEEVKPGTEIECKCGCIQKCIDKDSFISRWRVINVGTKRS